MPTSAPLKDAAYTFVGLNAIALENLSDALSEAADDMNERLRLENRFTDVRHDLTERFESLGDDVNGRLGTLPGGLDERIGDFNDDVADRWNKLVSELEGQIKQAKKTAHATTKDLRAKVDPAAEKFEARLPYRLARPLEAGRVATWDFFGTKAPARKTATKATAKKTAAKKTTAKRAPAKKTTAKRAPAKKAAAKA
ncbi:MAG: apolipoprotein A1/A4/E family protein [Acidimicrobiia bacterium]|nr:apolipoprotein A1/A4/E family protein [Acidimicrobiia bacterium]